MMDTDKNGNLSFEELKEGLVKLGHVLPDADVQMILDAVSFFPWPSFLPLEYTFQGTRLIRTLP